MADLTGVIERLHHEFPAVNLTDLVLLVRRCRHDIDTGAPEDCMPELVERLARIRLQDKKGPTNNDPTPNQPST